MRSPGSPGARARPSRWLVCQLREQHDELGKAQVRPVLVPSLSPPSASGISKVVHLPDSRSTTLQFLHAPDPQCALRPSVGKITSPTRRQYRFPVCELFRVSRDALPLPCSTFPFSPFPCSYPPCPAPSFSTLAFPSPPFPTLSYLAIPNHTAVASSAQVCSAKLSPSSLFPSSHLLCCDTRGPVASRITLVSEASLGPISLWATRRQAPSC